MEVALLQILVALSVETLRAFVWATVGTVFYVLFVKGRKTRA